MQNKDKLIDGFKEVIAVFSQNSVTPINALLTKCRVVVKACGS
jgi:hypothetical protein